MRGFFGGSHELRLASQRPYLENEKIRALIQEEIGKLAASLPAAVSSSLRQYKIVLPMHTHYFVREFECRIGRHVMLFLPEADQVKANQNAGVHTTVGSISKDSAIAVSSMVILDAVYAAARALVQSAEDIGGEGYQSAQMRADALRSQFRRHISFLLAHELAHSYVADGRTQLVPESTIDCWAAWNVAATYGSSATLGGFTNLAVAIREGRGEYWNISDDKAAKVHETRIASAVINIKRFLADPLLTAAEACTH